jgi:O-antigen biosynthesis protein
VHRLSAPSSPLAPFAAGEFGSGACTALRREAGRALGGFDPALGAGTASRGGEDLDLFVRVLLAGHAIVYEPAAMLSHRHPDEDRRLRSEIFGYGVGLVAMITKQALDGQALAIARRVPLALRHLRDPESRKNVRKTPDYPRIFDWIERAGMVAGPFAYLRARRHERRLAAAENEPAGAAKSP